MGLEPTRLSRCPAHTRFSSAWDLATQAEQAVMQMAGADPDPTRQIPRWMLADRPGFAKLQRWYRLAPSEMRRPRIQQSVLPMCFAAFAWAAANDLWPESTRQFDS